MKELISKLMDTADIDEPTAHRVVDIFKDFITRKLPPHIHTEITSLFASDDDAIIEETLDRTKNLF